MGLGYISVKVHPSIETKINRYVGYADVMPMDEGKLHATLIYDKRAELKSPLTDLDPNRLFKGTIMHVKEMGNRNSDNSLGAVALYIASGELLEEHLRLRDAGYQHGWDDYEAHVSLGYDLTPEQTVNLIKHLEPLIGTEILFYNESLEPTKQD